MARLELDSARCLHGYGAVRIVRIALETGNYYDFARYYSPTLGRFMSPDPADLAAVNPGNPQSWNRYSYVLNNPTSYIDPWGLIALSGCITIPACDGGGFVAGSDFSLLDSTLGLGALIHYGGRTGGSGGSSHNNPKPPKKPKKKGSKGQRRVAAALDFTGALRSAFERGAFLPVPTHLRAWKPHQPYSLPTLAQQGWGTRKSVHRCERRDAMRPPCAQRVSSVQ